MLDESEAGPALQRAARCRFSLHIKAPGQDNLSMFSTREIY
jgi:hypothetical protein